MTYQVKIQILMNGGLHQDNTVLQTNSISEARMFVSELIDVADGQDFQERVEEELGHAEEAKESTS